MYKAPASIGKKYANSEIKSENLPLAKLIRLTHSSDKNVPKSEIKSKMIRPLESTHIAVYEPEKHLPASTRSKQSLSLLPMEIRRTSV
jgi:hypothetical protein